MTAANFFIRHARIISKELTAHMVCPHCKKDKVCQTRGLCTSCYSDIEIRAQYPLRGRQATFGPGNFYGPGKPGAAPTSALPGSEAKIAVLTERVRLGQKLWHPEDGKIEKDWLGQGSAIGDFPAFIDFPLDQLEPEDDDQEDGD
jgi:hypothetical protein